MICYGKRLTQTDEPLIPISMEKLHSMVSTPDPALESTIRQLRIMRTVDEQQYTRSKRMLPYVVFAQFNPAVRRIDNFVSTDCFCIDIDHITEKGLSLEEVKARITTDTRVALAFTSPSGNGLKVVLTLSERCSDAGLFSLFYKQFASKFSFENGLEQIIDLRTCDVSRACFLSVDRTAYFNASPDPVDWHSFLPEDNASALFSMKQELDNERKQCTHTQEHIPDPDHDAMLHIKSMLGSKRPAPHKPEPTVPAALNEFIDMFRPYAEEAGLQINEVINIQYAKKIRFKVGLRLAEINVFYGRHGFKVVQSPRSGTSAELNQLAAELIQQFINENYS